MITVLALLLLQAASEATNPPIMIPKKAALVGPRIEEVTLGPLLREPFSCVEHPLGQLDFAGDALGTDCTAIGGMTASGGFAREFRTDVRANENWYRWDATHLAPFDGVVVGAFSKP